MNTSLQTSNTQPVTTYGWDTVFALPAVKVNAAIAANHSSPSGCSYSDSFSPNFDNQIAHFTVDAEFGNWQITCGGDGKNVRLLLPLNQVTFELTYQGKNYNSTYPTGTATIEVELQYFAHTDANGAQSHQLMVKSVADTPSQPAVYLITSTYEGDPDVATKSLLDSSLLNWCNANLAQFTHVFATVELNSAVDQAQWGFVAPNYTSYGYLDIGNLSDSLFAVLCMTGDRTGDKLSQQINSSSIPTGSVAGFLINQQRTLTDLIRPAVCLAYPGLTTGNFTLSTDGTTLSLQDGVAVNLAAVSHNGVQYYPVLKQLSVQADNTVLRLDSYTETPIDAFYGVTATCTATHWYNLALGISSNGQTLVFQESQPASIVHSYVQSQSGADTQKIIDIVASIALLILGILTDGAAFAVGGLIVGLAMGANNITPSAIGNNNQGDAPSIDLLLLNSTNPIQWTGGKTFTLNYVSLNGSLQMGGDPNFA